MIDESLPPDDEIIGWKTKAWQSKEMVESYAVQTARVTGPNMIKNAVETRLCRRHVHGTKVLDIGVGTGRASRPLALEGFDVWGIDASAAMLEKCRVLPGGEAMTLVEGDIARLPVEAAQFDTAMALNTLAHFPHWNTVLPEWQRVVKPGGKIIFDVFSMDHDRAVARAQGKDPEAGRTIFGPKKTEEFYVRVAAEELAEACARSGLTVASVTPYGALFGLASVNHFLDGTMAGGHSFDRLLSWAATDEQLFDLALFLEEELLARLGTAASGRFMVVLENRESPDGNRTWLAANEKRNEALASGITAHACAVIGIDREMLRERLDEFMRHEPSLVMLMRIVLAASHWKVPVALEELCSPAVAASLADVRERFRIDALVLETLQTWHQHPAIADAMTYCGVPIGATLEYDYMAPILDEVLHVFDAPIRRVNAELRE